MSTENSSEYFAGPGTESGSEIAAEPQTAAPEEEKQPEQKPDNVGRVIAFLLLLPVCSFGGISAIYIHSYFGGALGI